MLVTDPQRASSGRTFNALAGKRSHFRRKVLAHQVELVAAVLLSRVDGNLRRRKSENQPPMPRVYPRKPENVFKEKAISLGILAVKNNMRSENHDYPLGV